MNKKLRLLVTTKCNNKCPMCCNKQFDFNKVDIVNRWDYDEIMITGGEPLLFLLETASIASHIKGIQKAQGYNCSKIYVYTSCISLNIVNILNFVDGVTVTIHNKKDISKFIELSEYLLNNKLNYSIKDKSLRLNLFPDIKALLPKDIDLSLWKIKDIEWVKDCPIPEEEDFRRIANLY